MSVKQDIEQDIELAKMMAADIDKIYKKYAKSALQAQQDRIEKIRNEKYHGCVNVEELQNLYAYDEITLEEYDAGRDWFGEQQIRINQLSLVEQHRRNLKELRDKWKGTVLELQAELDELNGNAKGKLLTYVEQLELQERHERYAAMQ